mgnify:CR=1 FL=1
MLHPANKISMKKGGRTPPIYYTLSSRSIVIEASVNLMNAEVAIKDNNKVCKFIFVLTEPISSTDKWIPNHTVTNNYLP